RPSALRRRRSAQQDPLQLQPRQWYSHRVRGHESEPRSDRPRGVKRLRDGTRRRTTWRRRVRAAAGIPGRWRKGVGNEYVQGRRRSHPQTHASFLSELAGQRQDARKLHRRPEGTAKRVSGTVILGRLPDDRPRIMTCADKKITFGKSINLRN